MDITTIGSIVVAILGIVATILQTRGKTAEAEKARAAAELAKTIAAGVERHVTNTGDRSVKGSIKSLALDAGTQEELKDFLVKMGYSKP